MLHSSRYTTLYVLQLKCPCVLWLICVILLVTLVPGVMCLQIAHLGWPHGCVPGGFGTRGPDCRRAWQRMSFRLGGHLYATRNLFSSSGVVLSCWRRMCWCWCSILPTFGVAGLNWVTNGNTFRLLSLVFVVSSDPLVFCSVFLCAAVKIGAG